MFKFQFVFIVFVIVCTFNLKAYEWMQLTENGLERRSIELPDVKPNEPIKFEKIKFNSEKVSASELIKFPNLKSPQKIIFIGDTGCRLKDRKLGGGEFQNCNDLTEWPFSTILESVNKENADLLIHLGDYHYRENCHNLEDCKKYSSTFGYEWSPWELDYFKPMNAIGTKLPIVIVRGNHEDCERAFLGYRYFLKNSDWKEPCTNFENSEILEFDNMVIVNLDSSSVDDKPNLSVDEQKQWIKKLNEIYARLDKVKNKPVWIVTHKPIYGIAPFLKAYVPTNINLRKYLEESLLKDRVEFIFSGHVHTSMLVNSQIGIKQIILGNSGTKLEKKGIELSDGLTKLFGYKSAEFVNFDFGYAVVSRINKNWNIEYKNKNGELIKKINLK